MLHRGKSGRRDEAIFIVTLKFKETERQVFLKVGFFKR